ncbi:MAG: AAA-type ATPase lid domain-containing protein, partial [Gemmatimonadaceae bacterium]
PRALLTYDWPGNVREMENALEYAVTVCSGQTIHVEDLPADVRAPHPRVDEPPAADVIPLPSAQAFYSERVDEMRRVRDALIACRYDRTAAARSLGISRTTLWRKMKQYQI